MSKLIFIRYLLPAKPKLVPKFKNTQKFVKFDTFAILDMSISILMSKMVFMKYLPAATPN